ncbi:MAG: hypothetical protein KDJ65_39700 [Anaerolineae bacterium]|nr:hypothetical protein [Anaerolineae bacterium]
MKREDVKHEDVIGRLGDWEIGVCCVPSSARIRRSGYQPDLPAHGGRHADSDDLRRPSPGDAA